MRGRVMPPNRALAGGRSSIDSIHAESLHASQVQHTGMGSAVKDADPLMHGKGGRGSVAAARGRCVNSIRGPTFAVRSLSSWI